MKSTTNPTRRAVAHVHLGVVGVVRALAGRDRGAMGSTWGFAPCGQPIDLGRGDPAP